MSGYVGGGVKPIALYDSYTQAQANGLLDNKVDSPSLTSVSGTAVFTNSDNNINLTGIGGIGLEVGDVISVVGSASNDKLFTVEVITDVDNLIVNAAHAGGTTSKALVDETVAVDVSLLVKWFQAPIGLGQGWVDLTGTRANDINYSNLTNRILSVSATVIGATSRENYFFVADEIVARVYAAQDTPPPLINLSENVPVGETYRVGVPPLNVAGTISIWSELR